MITRTYRRFWCVCGWRKEFKALAKVEHRTYSLNSLRFPSNCRYFLRKISRRCSNKVGIVVEKLLHLSLRQRHIASDEDVLDALYNHGLFMARHGEIRKERWRIVSNWTIADMLAFIAIEADGIGCSRYFTKW